MEKFWYSFAHASRGLNYCLYDANVESGFHDILYTLRDMLEMEPYPIPELFAKFEDVNESPSDFMTWFINEMYEFADTLSSDSLKSCIEDYVSGISLCAIEVVTF